MVTATHTKKRRTAEPPIEYVRYDGSTMGTIPQLADAGRFITVGACIQVTDGARPQIMRWLNGDAMQRTFFTPISKREFEALPYCSAAGCNRVAFSTEVAKNRHLREHERYRDSEARNKGTVTKLRKDEAQAAVKLQDEKDHLRGIRKMLKEARAEAKQAELERGVEPVIIDPRAKPRRTFDDEDFDEGFTAGDDDD